MNLQELLRTIRIEAESETELLKWDELNEHRLEYEQGRLAVVRMVEDFIKMGQVEKDERD